MSALPVIVRRWGGWQCPTCGCRFAFTIIGKRLATCDSCGQQVETP